MSRFNRVAVSVEQVASMAVSSNYFSALGIRPVIGRFFLPEEERGHGTHSVAVIGHSLWRRLFNGEPAALGKTIKINNHLLTVVGVTPPEFTGTVAAMNPGVYVTLGTRAQMRDIPLDLKGNFTLYVLGRLRPGVSRAQAEARLLVLAEQINQVKSFITYKNIIITDGNRGTNPFALEGYYWLIVTLFQTPTILVFLVACANVANILLARGMMRRREFEVRAAIGAGRWRLIRQSLTENLVVALIGAGLGILLALWGKTVISELLIGSPKGLRYDTSLDPTVLGFMLVITLIAALLSGLLPAGQLGVPPKSIP